MIAPADVGVLLKRAGLSALATLHHRVAYPFQDRQSERWLGFALTARARAFADFGRPGKGSTLLRSLVTLGLSVGCENAADQASSERCLL
jgi:hypothetical protein